MNVKHLLKNTFILKGVAAVSIIMTLFLCAFVLSLYSSANAIEVQNNITESTTTQENQIFYEDLPSTMTIINLDTGEAAVQGKDYEVSVFGDDTKIEIMSNNLKVSGNADVPEQAYIALNNDGGVDTLTIENINLIMPGDEKHEWSEDVLLYINSEEDFHLHVKGKCSINSYWSIDMMLSTNSNDEINFLIDGDVDDELNFNSIFDQDENFGAIVFNPTTWEVDHKIQFLGSLNLNFNKHSWYGTIGWDGVPFSTLIFGDNTKTTINSGSGSVGPALDWWDGCVVIKDNAKMVLNGGENLDSSGLWVWDLKILDNASFISVQELGSVFTGFSDKRREGYGNVTISTTGEVSMHGFYGNSICCSGESNLYIDKVKQLNVINDTGNAVWCDNYMYVNTGNIYLAGSDYTYGDNILYSGAIRFNDNKLIIDDSIKMYGSETLKEKPEDTNMPCSLIYHNMEDEYYNCWTSCIDDSANEDARIAQTVRFVKTKYNITGTVTDADDLLKPVADARVEFCRLTPSGAMPIPDMYTYTDMNGNYTFEAAEFENNLPAVIRVNSQGYETAESSPILSLPEGENTIKIDIQMKKEQPDPVPDEPGVDIETTAEIAQTSDSASWTFTIFVVLALCGLFVFVNNTKRRNIVS